MTILGTLKIHLRLRIVSNWAKLGVNERAKILVSISDDLESSPYQLIYYLMNEAGKTIQNAIDEIREAVDFLRYYSNQMIDIEETDQKLEGPLEKKIFLHTEQKATLFVLVHGTFLLQSLLVKLVLP